MRGSGQFLAKTMQSASDAGLRAFKSVAATAAAGRYLAGAAKDKAVSAASAAAAATKQAAVSAANATKHAAVSAAQASRQAVVSTVVATKKVASAAAQKAQDAAKATFGPRIVGQPIQKCPCNAEEKKARAQERKQAISTARNRAGGLPSSDRQRLLAAAQRFEENNKAVDRARLSRDVYGGESTATATDPCAHISPPVGWKKADPADYGLDKKDLEPSGSGFRAAIYKADDGTTVLAFKGTESKEDWKNNFQQSLGFKSVYYDQAAAVGTTMKNNFGDKFEITGHSLGGGLASAAALATGAPATTFNAAGLNARTVDRFGHHSPPVQAYQVTGDLLTSGQKAAPALAVASAANGHLVLGVALNQVEDSYGTKRALPAVTDTGASYLTGVVSPLDPLTRHSMDTVINGLEKQKADDMDVIKTTGL